MDQNYKRSVSLKPVSYTSPSVTNKGNRIRVLSPRALLHVTIQECVVFSFMEPVYMLLPVWPSPLPFQSREGLIHLKDSQPAIETFAVERLINSSEKTAENRLTVTLPESPGRILNCRVKNITLNKKITPGVYDFKHFATAVYSYEIEITYQDTAGQIKQETYNSGIRCLQVLLPPPAKTFNVSIHCLCAFS